MVPQVTVHPHNESAWKLLVNLTMSADDRLEVRSCEIVSDSFRNRTSFHGKSHVQDVFVTEVADAINACISSLSFRTELVSLPNFTVEMPGLILSDASLICTETNDGNLNIIFRINRFVGGVNRLFLNRIGFEDPLSPMVSEISARVLSDIAVPLLDLCAIAQQDLGPEDGPLGAFGKKLRERSAELEFHIELIKRFVENTQTVPVVPPAKFRDMAAPKVEKIT